MFNHQTDVQSTLSQVTVGRTTTTTGGGGFGNKKYVNGGQRRMKCQGLKDIREFSIGSNWWITNSCQHLTFQSQGY